MLGGFAGWEGLVPGLDSEARVLHLIEISDLWNKQCGLWTYGTP